MNESVRNLRDLARPPSASPRTATLSPPIEATLREERKPESAKPPTRFPVSAPQWQAVAEALGLSPRELQIVQGIFDGGTESTLAGELRISVHTVHSHLDRMYRKLQVPSRTGLALRVFQEILNFERASTF